MTTRIEFGSRATALLLLALFTAAAVLAATPEVANAGQAVSAPSERAAGGPSAEESVERQQRLHARLIALVPEAAENNGIRIRLTDEEKASIAKQIPSGPGPVRIGLTQKLSRAAGLAGGSATTAADGSFVWAMKIGSEDAGGVRVHLQNISLPAGAELYFLSAEGEAHGPYTGRGPDGDGDLWTPAVFSQAGLLVLTALEEIHGNPFLVTEVGHIGGEFTGKLEKAGTGYCGNADCILDASCIEESGHPAYDPNFPTAAGYDPRDAVAQMEWISGAWIYTCTGGLLADKDDSTQIPYFLTANHCISREKDAKNMEAYFFYRTAQCNDPCPADGSPSYRTVGATVRATGTAGDFTLLELKESPPSEAVFLGWNKSPIAFTGGAPLYRISHPNFGPQVFSRHAVDTAAVQCSRWPRGERIYSMDTSGATDGGSSGSPVLNAAGQVVGQLAGCCGYACSDVCDSVQNSTVDGALAFYWDQVQPFLDPDTTPCTPSTEVCDDGVDNDCDDAVDCADGDCSGNPACAGSPCTLGQLGASCTNNADCCSNNCKGKPDQRTCK